MIYGCHFFQNIYILEVYIYLFFHWKCTSTFLCFVFDTVFSLKKNTFIYSICFRRYCIWSYFDQLLVNAYLAHTETGKI